VHTLKFKLIIAYDGTNYAGWQVQRSGIGVQQRIEEALAKLFRSAPCLYSSSRTDSGVHALGMVAHFEVPAAEFKMPVAKLPLSINAHLAEDIRIMRASRCRNNFHARFDATGKQYRYFVWNHHSLNPLLRLQSWLVPRSLDMAAMRIAAADFIGKHDFVSFAGVRDYQMESTIRTVSRCDIRRSGNLVTFLIEGDGFLYKMCRVIVGTLVQIGHGKFEPSSIRKMIESKDRCEAGMTAPAHGLVLWKVFYDRRKPRQPDDDGEPTEHIMQTED
jgi:tRNA pseudouridine38-40 synthase